MECIGIDQDWMDLWQTEPRITHSSSYYSLPPIDEDYEWNLLYGSQPMDRLNRVVSTITLPTIGEEMSLHVGGRPRLKAYNYPVFANKQVLCAHSYTES